MAKKVSPVVIIGGGPAGIMAAIAASGGARDIVLFNKNPWIGKKVEAADREGLYYTEDKSINSIAAAFKDKSKFVKSIIEVFDNIRFLEFCSELDLPLTKDKNGRYISKGVTARDFFQRLLDEAISRGVRYKKSSRVTDIYLSRKKIAGVVVNNSKFAASKVIIASGSFSSPKYGSTRDGYFIAENLGHRVTDLKPALLDLMIFERYGDILEGRSFKDIEIKIIIGEKIVHTIIGDIRFGYNSISGPVILDHSAEIIQKLPGYPVEVHLDFMPSIRRANMVEWFKKGIKENRKISIGHFLSKHFPESVINAVQVDSGIRMTKSVAHISTLELKTLKRSIKEFRLSVKAPMPFNSTRGVIGGVDTTEVDPATCESKIVKSLYFAGDVLDVLGPWGGYNMQFAFSSGYVAGKSASKR